MYPKSIYYTKDLSSREVILESSPVNKVTFLLERYTRIYIEYIQWCSIIYIQKPAFFFFGYCVPFIVGYYVGKTLGKNIHCLREYIISIILPQHVPPSEIILIEVFEVYSTNVQI